MVFIPGLRRPAFDPFTRTDPMPAAPLDNFQPGGLPVNVLQELQQPEPVAVTRAATAMDQRPNFQVPDMPLPEVKPPRERRSFLDTVGRLADVFATVGGADALYQPTLDAREDRTRMIDMEALKRQQMEQQLAMGGEEAALLQRQKAGVAMKGLQAIAARGGDVNAAWPILARQAGIKPEDTAVLGDMISKDPNAIPAIAAMFGQEQEFGLQPFYAQDAQGNLQAYQIGKDGSLQPINLPNGSQPVDPLKFVDTGNQQVGVGSRTGRPIRILPKGVDPNTGARIQSSERIAGANIASRENIASMRGPGGKQAPQAAGGAETALANIAELRGIYGTLNNMGAMVSPKQGTGANIWARARASGAGQLVEGTIGTEAQTQRDRIGSIRPGLMQSLAKATGMTGKQLDSNADVKLFMQTVTDPTASYEANMAALDGLERFVRANAKQPAPAPRAAPRRIAPRRAPARPAPRGGGKPSVSNW